MDGKEVTTYVVCGKGCFIPDNKWREYSATCSLETLVRDNKN